jgi:hypothetical protein
MFLLVTARGTAEPPTVALAAMVAFDLLYMSVHPRHDGNAVALNADSSNVSPRDSDFPDCRFSVRCGQ